MLLKKQTIYVISECTGILPTDDWRVGFGTDYPNGKEKFYQHALFLQYDNNFHQKIMWASSMLLETCS